MIIRDVFSCSGLSQCEASNNPFSSVTFIMLTFLRTLNRAKTTERDHSSQKQITMEQPHYAQLPNKQLVKDLRIILGICWPDIISTTKFQRETDQQPAEDEIKR